MRATQRRTKGAGEARASCVLRIRNIIIRNSQIELRNYTWRRGFGDTFAWIRLPRFQRFLGSFGPAFVYSSTSGTFLLKFKLLTELVRIFPKLYFIVIKFQYNRPANNLAIGGAKWEGAEHIGVAPL